jgi:hypothetical protein
MAVQVVVGRHSTTGNATKTAKHPTGAAFFVQDGHLVIKEGTYNDARHIAVYAPGGWVSVELVADQD